MLNRIVLDDRLRQRAAVEQLIRRIYCACPQRASGSRQQSRAQRMLRRELKMLDGQPQWQRFHFNRSLYGVIALHFALAAISTLLIFVAPLAAAALHLLLAVSYVADSQRWGYLLRRVFRFHPTQNLVVTFPARSRVRRRIVVIAHADAAPTGWLFRPWLASLGGGRAYPRYLRFLGKPLLLGVLALGAAAGMEIAMAWHGNLWPQFPILYIVCNLYFVVVAALNLQIAWRHEVVPGANDNLSGCAALPALAQRLIGEQPDDVEFVFVVTGSEEAGTGGALALARQQRVAWDIASTDILVLDSLSGGDLRLFQEGELLTQPIPSRLWQAAQRIAERDERFAEVLPFALPAGATDAWPFLVYGYAALGVGCIDAATGTPRHYHLPDDSPENLDYDQLLISIDFAELMIRKLADMPAATNRVRAHAP